MYDYQGLKDYLFIMLYGGAACFALISCLYLLFRRGNAVAPDVKSSCVLRLWTAALMAAIVGSHVWWYALGVVWLTDDQLVRNMTTILLDHATLVPLVMAVLLRMLQDRRRPLWPVWVAVVPVVVFGVMGIAQRDWFYGYTLAHYWQLGTAVVFIVYYAFALRQYGRWLRDNYADLERKEVWQSLVFALALFVVYELYTSNMGQLSREYLSQLLTVAIVAFLLWRVETLQEMEVEVAEDSNEEADVSSPTIRSNIGLLLHDYCEVPALYLQHNLTVAQLSEAIGTNRTYLSQYFTQQGITYNTYINRLRIDYFERLYLEAAKERRPVTARQLANESGFKSYSTFAAAFKLYKGQTVTAWMKEQSQES